MSQPDQTSRRTSTVLRRLLGPNLSFLLMAWRQRRRARPEVNGPVLDEASLAPGMTVLDFGCGPGYYTIPAARRVGPSGTVIALDKLPIAAWMVRAAALRHGIRSVRTVTSDLATGLPGASVDVVLFYDVLHHLPTPVPLLQEFHRVLKLTGLLSVSDHHMHTGDIIAAITDGGYFAHRATGRHTISFTPQRC